MNGCNVTQDFGVWNISYEVVSCSEWKGWNDASALGSVPSLGDGACCPADPTVSRPTFQTQLFLNTPIRTRAIPVPLSQMPMESRMLLCQSIMILIRLMLGRH